MFGIGLPELLIIMVVALVVVGPDKLPDLARALGRAYAEFRKTLDDLKETVDEDGTLRDLKREFTEAKHSVMYGPVNKAPRKNEARPAPPSPQGPAAETPSPPASGPLTGDPHAVNADRSTAPEPVQTAKETESHPDKTEPAHHPDGTPQSE